MSDYPLPAEIPHDVGIYEKIYHVISVLAAYALSDGLVGAFQSRHLCEVASEILPLLPRPVVKEMMTEGDG